MSQAMNVKITIKEKPKKPESKFDNEIELDLEQLDDRVRLIATGKKNTIGTNSKDVLINFYIPSGGVTVFEHNFIGLGQLKHVARKRKPK